jgi:DNA-3-methyladenine glycosylase II
MRPLEPLEPTAEFVLPLPRGYDAAYTLAYHGRDAASSSERVDGAVIVKPLLIAGGVLILAIDLGASSSEAVAHIRLDRPVSAELQATIVERVSRMLGLASDVEGFEAFMASHPHGAATVGRRAGIHLPQTADPFEALCWAIIGQQINLTFTATLRREVVDLAGVRHAATGMVAHPGAVEVAALDPAALTARRFSRSKARYLIGAANRIADGSLNLAGLAHATPAEAEVALVSLHGIGPWTARYIMLRGLGFPDVAPIGDSGLATALQRLHGLPARPDAAAQEALMQSFSPYRSLTTAHLWAGLAG